MNILPKLQHLHIHIKRIYQVKGTGREQMNLAFRECSRKEPINVDHKRQTCTFLNPISIQAIIGTYGTLDQNNTRLELARATN